MFAIDLEHLNSRVGGNVRPTWLDNSSQNEKYEQLITYCHNPIFDNINSQKWNEWRKIEFWAKTTQIKNHENLIRIDYKFGSQLWSKKKELISLGT